MSESDYEPLFALYEYARAEQIFIHTAVPELARSRDSLFGQIRNEPVGTAQTTQVTVDSGETVEMKPMPVRYKITIDPNEVISGSLDTFLVSLDKAAEEFLGELMPQFYEHLSRISEATGNVVDAKGRPFIDSLFEMIEKIELDFDEDGEHGGVLVVHPDQAPMIEEALRNITPEQQKKLDDLMQRKREEADARRRRRRLS